MHVCMCMYLCMCPCVCVYVYMPVCMYECICMFVFVCIHLCMYVCLCVGLCVCLCVYVWYASIYVCICMCVCLCEQVCAGTEARRGCGVLSSTTLSVFLLSQGLSQNMWLVFNLGHAGSHRLCSCSCPTQSWGCQHTLGAQIVNYILGSEVWPS